jgi:NTP pyrophosphatase (non-canonical NTP hydrolase)
VVNFNEYQEKSRVTAGYPNLGDNVPYLALGTTGEAGEIAEKVKKLIRDHGSAAVASITEEQRDDLVKEMGDVLWYLAQLCTELSVDMNTMAERNIEKLYSRMERNVIKGNGDNR